MSLVTVSPYNSIQFWDITTLEERATFQDEIDYKVPLSLSADGSLLATVTRDGRIKLWRARKSEHCLLSVLTMSGG